MLNLTFVLISTKPREQHDVSPINRHEDRLAIMRFSGFALADEDGASKEKQKGAISWS